MTVESLEYLRHVPIIENGDALVHIADYAPLVHLRTDADVVPLLRPEVATRLCTASEILAKEGIELFVWHAYRSPQYQHELYDARRSDLEVLHSTWPANIVNRETNRAVAPLDPRVPPPHCTGAAVDVLPMRDGVSLDFDRLPPEDWSMAPTDCESVSLEIRKLRAHLCKVLESTGLSNYPEEFWHYSYGDQAWAARTGAAHAIYGLVDVV